MARKKKETSASPEAKQSGSQKKPETVAARRAREQAKRKTARDIERAEKIKEALDYRKMGYSYAEIAEQMNIGRTTAFDLVKARIAMIPKESAEDVRELELARLDGILSKLMEILEDAPEMGVIDMVFKVQDRRAKYVSGLYVAPPVADDPMSKMMAAAGERFAEMVAADRPMLAPDAPIPANPVL